MARSRRKQNISAPVKKEENLEEILEDGIAEEQPSVFAENVSDGKAEETSAVKENETQEVSAESEPEVFLPEPVKQPELKTESKKKKSAPENKKETEKTSSDTKDVHAVVNTEPIQATVYDGEIKTDMEGSGAPTVYICPVCGTVYTSKIAFCPQDGHEVVNIGTAENVWRNMSQELRIQIVADVMAGEIQNPKVVKPGVKERAENGLKTLQKAFSGFVLFVEKKCFWMIYVLELIACFGITYSLFHSEEPTFIDNVLCLLTFIGLVCMSVYVTSVLCKLEKEGENIDKK